MSKVAPTQHPVADLIKKRWSPRSFSEKQIAQEDVETLLEAASWAFSASNLQPWNYVYAHRGTDGFHKLWECLMPGNQPWTKHAAVLVVAIANNKLENGQPNPWARHDVGAANATLMLQALTMDIYGHVMAGFDSQKVISTLQLDTEKQEPVVVMALGYLDSHEKLEEPYKSRETAPRSRKKIEEFTKKI